MNALPRRIAALVIVLFLAMEGVAVAAWIASGAGSGGAGADRVPQAAAPTTSVTGRNVSVTWNQVKFKDEGPVSGYTVKRYGADGSVQTIKANCTGTQTGLSCNERAVPPGSWTYSVTAQHSLWSGPESDRSAAVTVGAPQMTITSGQITSLPGTVSGNLENFITGQTVTFRLDSQSGQTLQGSISPSPVPESGSVTFNATIPSGTSNGTHTLFAIGSDGDVASAPFSVAVGPKPTSLRINSGGSPAQPGRPNLGDTVVVTYSERMSVSTFCSSWSNDNQNQNVNANNEVNVTIQNNAAGSGNDLLVVALVGTNPSCGGTFKFGSVDLGSPDFVSGNATFRGSGSSRSSIAWNATSFTLTITLGALQASDTLNVLTEPDSVTATYTPNPDLKGSSGYSIQGTVQSPNQRQF